MIKNIAFLFIFLLITGCTSPKKLIVADVLDATPVITGSVVNSSAFVKGGSLVIGSFKAGVGAEANDETDELSWMMVKGIRDTLPHENTHLKISTDDQGDSDFELEGYIDDYGRDPHLSHMKLRKDQIHLAIDGEIWLRDTGEKVILFQTSTVIDLKNQNPKTEAYQIGVAVAHFIGSNNLN